MSLEMNKKTLHFRSVNLQWRHSLHKVEPNKTKLCVIHTVF